MTRLNLNEIHGMTIRAVPSLSKINNVTLSAEITSMHHVTVRACKSTAAAFFRH